MSSCSFIEHSTSFHAQCVWMMFTGQVLEGVLSLFPPLAELAPCICVGREGGGREGGERMEGKGGRGEEGGRNVYIGVPT